MSYTVLANRYRPRTFDDVVGQLEAARVLRTAIATGRAGHAFLFSGPRGVGKTSMARILAKALDCLSNDQGDPCGTCSVCRAIDQGHGCLDVVEIDGASHNKVENVRELIEGLRFRPVEARYRITIVDEVHMLSTAAFNALLKTLEEPPAHAKFILATTEPLKVPETIRSRCQLFDFRRLTAQDIEARLRQVCEAEGVTAPAELLARLARHAQGGLRDALSLLDQLVTYGEGRPTLEDFERLTGRLPPELVQRLLAAAVAGDVAATHAAGAEAFARGARPADLLGQLTDVLEGLLATAAGGEPADRTEAERAALAELAARSNLDQVLAMLDVLVEAAQRLRQRHDGRLVVEMALLTLARLPALQSVADLLEREGSQAPAAPRTSGAGSKGAPPALGAAPAASPAPAARTGPPPAGTARREAQAEPVDFRSAFLDAVESRSLRLELARYPVIRREGDELVVVPPSDPSPLFDPSAPDVRQQLAAAAAKAAGGPLTVRIDLAGKTAPPPPAARGRAARQPPGGAARHVQQQWPGAERVDG